MSGLRVVGLFAGVGGIEAGLAAAGHESVLLCEALPEARAVLRQRFAAPVVADVRDLADLSADVDVVAAGFPCQDLSSVGPKGGIAGRRSGLVDELFRLLSRRSVPWVLLENVPFLLHLDRGRAMWHLTTTLEGLGYRWAYRVVDTRGFGLPQRRRRVVLVAGLDEDPRTVVLADDGDVVPDPDDPSAHGFYWTEGRRALGWAVDAVPPIKGGSSIGVPSPPAVLTAGGHIGTPTLADAERLQGFPAGWTSAAGGVVRDRHRWRLVGNAVSVPVAAWVGRRLGEPGVYRFADDERPLDGRWSAAAHGGPGAAAMGVPAGPHPLGLDVPPLMEVLGDPLTPLSRRAAEGFLRRYRAGSLRRKPVLEDAVVRHLGLLAA